MSPSPHPHILSSSLAIPEEIYSKSLPEHEKRTRGATTLQPHLTPRSQQRRSTTLSQRFQPQTTSPLLSDSTDDTDDTDEFHDGTDDPAKLLADGEDGDGAAVADGNERTKAAAVAANDEQDRIATAASNAAMALAESRRLDGADNDDDDSNDNGGRAEANGALIEQSSNMVNI